MRVLFLAKYGRKAATTRYRILQFLPYLHEHGVETSVAPLFDDAYLEARFARGRGRLRDFSRALLGRWRALRRAGEFDLVVLHYELVPYLPKLLELFAWPRGVPVVLDYDDATFHNYDHHRMAFVRWLLRGKIFWLMQHARHIIVGNDYLATYARAANPAAVTIIPTVIDLTTYRPAPAPSASASAAAPLVVGWIGSPSTGRFVAQIRDALQRFFATHPHAKLVLVGSGPMELPGVPVEIREWAEAREIAEIQGFDIGIMPLSDDPWSHGKCGFKLIQYMGCAKPVVASPIGANADIVLPGETGLFARDADEWVSALTRLAADAVLRREMGAAGRVRAEQRYSLSTAAPALLRALHDAATTTVIVTKS